MTAGIMILIMPAILMADVALSQENFPDDTFRFYLEGRCDRDGDMVLSDAEIEAFTDTGRLYDHLYNGKRIQSLKGIEHFPNL